MEKLAGKYYKIYLLNIRKPALIVKGEYQGFFFLDDTKFVLARVVVKSIVKDILKLKRKIFRSFKGKFSVFLQ